MVNRKKRLKKSIESLEEQVLFHEEKKQLAEELGKRDLVEYYEKEIGRIKIRKRDREEMIEKA